MTAVDSDGQALGQHLDDRLSQVPVMICCFPSCEHFDLQLGGKYLRFAQPTIP